MITLRIYLGYLKYFQKKNNAKFHTMDKGFLKFYYGTQVEFL